MSDSPLYAPGLSWKNSYATWKAPARYVKAGYMPKSIKLPAGHKDDAHALDRAQKCREYTREMLKWWSNQDSIQEGTWHWLFSKYRSDQFSPIHKVKQNTRDNYLWCISRWDSSIGKAKLQDANYEFIIGLQVDMEKNGRSAAYIKRLFTMLRTVVSYGAMIEDPQAARISGILSLMRIKNPTPRTVAPTREQIEAIIKAADDAGDKMFALGLSIQWWFSLRAVDVRGQWLKSDEVSGITRSGKRWQDGMTWNMINREVTEIRKVISKTSFSNVQERVFDLTSVPELRERLLSIPPERRTGPLIVTARYGLPYDLHGWSRAFRRYARAAGVPDEVQAMDTRAGAITDAKLLGADQYALRDAAGHSNISTTDRYARSNDENANKVVRLRAGI